MTFFDGLGVGIEQYRVDFPFGTSTCYLPIPIIVQLPKGLAKERKPWVFEYSFYWLSNDDKKVFIGEKVLEFGDYIFANCLKFYVDPELKYPATPDWGPMLWQVIFEINDENLSLKDMIATLDMNENAKWLLHGQFTHPLNDTITELEILIPEMFKGFLKIELKPNHLENGDTFKLLFTFTKNDAYLGFCKAIEEKKLLRYESFGIRGKGRRSGES